MPNKNQSLRFFSPTVAVCAALLLAPFNGHAEESDDYQYNLIATYGEFSDWPEQDRMEYLAEWRRAWTNFELGLQQRGQRFATATAVPGWWNWLVPESWGENPQCIAGGWRMNANKDGLCPTRGHPCGPSPRDSFECGPVYSHACISREPIATLSRRCSDGAREAARDGAHDGKLSEDQYNERRHALESLLADCQNKTFSPRFNDNCKLLMHDADSIVHKYSKLTTKVAGEKTKPKTDASSQPEEHPKYCENQRAVIIRNSPGGEGGLAMARARAVVASGARIELQGHCDSACIDFPAIAPNERVCVGPNARLGFHMYTRDITRQFVDERYTREVFATYSPEIQNWLRGKRLYVDHMVYLQGAELRKIYQSCDELYAACKAQHGAAWRPSKQREKIVQGDILF